MTSPTGRDPAGPPTASLDADLRVTRLHLLTAALSSAVTMKDVARVVFEQGLEQFGARAVGIVWMVEAGKFDLVFGHGVTEEEFGLLDAAARSGERLPIRDAIVGRRPVWLETPAEIREQYPVLEPLRERRGESGCAVVPLVIGERTHGVIGFTFAREGRLAEVERSFIEALAQTSAHAFERARAFEAEQRARLDAERTRELQEQLMAVVGHDLRTPLMAIQLTAESLAKRLELPEHSRALRRIRSSAERMNAIIRDLLDFSRARRGLGISIRRRAVNVLDVVRRTVAEFGDADRARLAVTSSGDVNLQADPERLSQVLSNLVGNALQHGRGAAVRIDVEGDDAAVAISVHNDGPPIDPAMLPHVFEPFRRGDRETDHRGSVGLGLFIVREIVRAHGGDVEVRSAAGAGTSFTVLLPRSAGERRLAEAGPQERT